MPKILLIEDIDDNAALIQKVVSARGYEIFWAKNGQSGLEMASEISPDLILLDLGLPDIDGQTLVKYLRSVPKLEDTPIIVVTAWPEETAKLMVSAYGCDGYVGKPVDIKLLTQKIQDHLPPE
jgi:two-component system cell cycle response regulator DivK